LPAWLASRGESVVATVRSDDRARRLRDEGFHAIAGPAIDPETLLPHVTSTTHVVVSFAPDRATTRASRPA
jgi:Trk K+ transport system NAD-binding subunit